MKNKSQFEIIKNHYNIALNYIIENKWNLAIKELYVNMNIILYDLSIDIMFNTNEECKNKKLRTLIKKVDKFIINYSINNKDELITDDDKNNIF